MKRLLVACLLVSAPWWSGCCRRPPGPTQAWRETLTQVSTYEALKAGRYDGQLACSNLLQYGDTGLGTFEGLDGEMVVLKGRIYQVAVDGSVQEADPAWTVPFADVTWFEPDVMFDVAELDQKVFQNTMRWKRPDPAHAYALRVTGQFRRLSVRSVPRQAAPYPPLEQVVAEQQQVRELTNVPATMVGFLLPDEVGVLLPPGFHLHALTEDLAAGGHVLDFELAGGRIELDQTPALQVLLPPTAPPK
jgi:acetolactate decarboxylase